MYVCSRMDFQYVLPVFLILSGFLTYVHVLWKVLFTSICLISTISVASGMAEGHSCCNYLHISVLGDIHVHYFSTC